MDFTFFIFFLSIFYAAFVMCQRLSPGEMMKLIEYFPNVLNSEETKKCLPAIKGNYHPEITYALEICEGSSAFFQTILAFCYNVYQNLSINCSGYQCWESVLTDASKLDILDIFNTYRQTVARGTCGSWCESNKEKLIFSLRWDYHCEYEATDWLNKCKKEEPTFSFVYEATKVIYRGEYFRVTFKVETGLQSEFRAKLIKLLEGNYLKSWNKTTKQFRRGIANRIGCAYIVRYGVNVITDLNENVQSGNIAHFGCFIGAYFTDYEKNKTINPFVEDFPQGEPYTAASTSENCAKIAAGTELQPNSLYPSLCTEGTSVQDFEIPLMLCQPDAKYYKAIYYNLLCKNYSSKKNAETWNEKPYGFIVRVDSHKNIAKPVLSLECNLPEFPEPRKPKPEDIDNVHKLNFDCTLKQEVSLLTTSEACLGWSCDESQLTDETRQYVVNKLNMLRHFVAQGLCSELCHPPCSCNVKYCNIVKLRWHWYLESKAAEIVQNCTTEYGTRKTHYVNAPFQEPVFYEEVSLIFELPPDGQITLADEFTLLFWTNGLNDWNKDGTFRRGNAAWMGCAVVIRPGQQINNTRQEYKIENGSTTHMVCIFASFDEDFISRKGPSDDFCCPTCTSIVPERPCRFRTAKKQAPFPNLCTSVLLPEVTMNCAVNKCPSPHQQSKAWKLFIDGETTIEHHNNSLQHINRASPESYGYMRQVYLKKMCKILYLVYLVTIGVLCLMLALLYKHFVEKQYYAKLSKK